MARRVERRRGRSGGIAGLALVMRDHAAALDYDCMTMTGRTLDEYADMGAAGTVALVHLVRYLGPDSALWRETHVEDGTWRWATAVGTNAILADMYDKLSMIDAHLVNAHYKNKVRKVDPYPRPNDGPRGEVVGKGSLPISEFEEWWRSGE